MFGRRKGNDGTVKTGSDTPAPTAERLGPRMYRADSAMAPVPGSPVVDAARRAPDVTATTGRRAEVVPSAPGDLDSKKLVVGRGIALSGEIRACDMLIVEGQVEATLSDSRAITISFTGVFKGKAQIEEAEISGQFDGELVASKKLMIHSTGKVVGNIRYGQIEITRGGVISGRIDVLASAAADEPGAGSANPTASTGQGAAEHN